jgi:hypothetical protein
VLRGQEVLRRQEVSVAPRLPARLSGSAYRQELRAVPLEYRRALQKAARDSVAGFAQATQEHGSLLQSWIRGQAVREYEHHPPNDVIDLACGTQFYYHAHRDGATEHGHVHLFWHATASGARRYARDGNQRWVRTAPSHLLAIALDARGLPVGLFTTNRWVSGGHWFDAATTLGMVRRFRVRGSVEHAASCQWLQGFLRMYEPLIEPLLLARDAALHRCAAACGGNVERALVDERHEVLSQVRIDWARDLDAVEALKI